MGKRRTPDQCLLVAVNQGHVNALKYILKSIMIFHYKSNRGSRHSSYVSRQVNPF